MGESTPEDRRGEPAGPMEAALLAALRAEPLNPVAIEAARLALVRQWDRLAWQEAIKWFRTNANRGDIDDYHAAAVLGMWEAVQKFDPGKGFVFATYAYWYVLKHLKPLSHQEASSGLHIPLEHGLTGVTVRPFGQISVGDGSVPYEGTIPDRESSELREEPPVADEVWAAVDDIVTNPRERLVLRRRFRDGRTLEQIGAEVGVSKERVRQVERIALDRLRKMGGAFTGFVDS